MLGVCVGPPALSARAALQHESVSAAAWLGLIINRGTGCVAGDKRHEADKV